MSINENVKTYTGTRLLTKVFSSELFWVSAFTLLTFLAAQVAVPVQPVPFTLQTMVVLLSGAFLGSKNGAYSQILYIGLGAIGMPVFANFSSFPSLLGPTAGYLLAFPLGAYLVGLLTERKRNLAFVLVSMAISNLLILFIGSAYLSIFSGTSFSNSFFAGALIFSIWDIIKISAAASIYSGIAGKINRLPF